ncbi:unnamed protein product [Cuscuta europaea]|uniref:Integrase catalytic domain-containing protein n=1 Tax=Cuscuta europaea TaxID=41803 RepID=A0A9P1EP74_CUSEU|nr:unnamed protein product [Cuscuta europaea]
MNKGDVYSLPDVPVPSSPCVNVTTKFSLNKWHCRLGHPALPITQKVISSLGISFKDVNKDLSLCTSCASNKSHKLPFAKSSLSSSGPLDLIYTDVWGPSHINSVDGFRYYVIFVDHYTKYIWFYTITHKSEVTSIFQQFKKIVENFFQKSIKMVYSDGGGEYISQGKFLASCGITHLLTPPYTPEHNGFAERRHRHIVETGITLLHHSSMPLKYWSYAFLTAVYLINRQPTASLGFCTPYAKLFQKPPNYTKLAIFGCQCFPWLRPYAAHKLEPRSRPCIFLGYCDQQSAYRCLDPTTNRIFFSRHVVFNESVFPFSNNTTPVTDLSSEIDSWLQPPISYLPISGTSLAKASPTTRTPTTQDSPNPAPHNTPPASNPPILITYHRRPKQNPTTPSLPNVPNTNPSTITPTTNNPISTLGHHHDPKASPPKRTPTK